MRGDWASQGRLPPPGKKRSASIAGYTTRRKTTKLAANHGANYVEAPIHPVRESTVTNIKPLLSYANGKRRARNGHITARMIIRSASTSQNYPTGASVLRHGKGHRADRKARARKIITNEVAVSPIIEQHGRQSRLVTLPQREARRNQRKEREADLLPAETERTTPAAAKWPRSGKS